MLDITIKAPDKSLKWVTRWILTYTRENGDIWQGFFTTNKDATNELIRLKYGHNRHNAQVKKCTGYEGKDKHGKYFIPRDVPINNTVSKS